MGESLVYAIKIAIVVAATLAFTAAIVVILGLVTSFTTTSVLGEIIGIISVFLPFSASSFFGILSAAITAMCAFLVAHKIYELLTNAQKSA